MPPALVAKVTFMTYRHRKTRLMITATHTSRCARRHSAASSLRTFSEILRNVRFTPKSGHYRSANKCPLCAKSGREQVQQKSNHSMISSARARKASGMVNPSAFAVVRLMMRLNLVGCSTGMLAGFVPRRTLSTRSAARRNRSM